MSPRRATMHALLWVVIVLVHMAEAPGVRSRRGRVDAVLDATEAVAKLAARVACGRRAEA